MLSRIEQVEMLIVLGRGDKYRLTHIRESLESGKELYISDKDFLQNLVKTHLGDKIYQARIVSISEKPNLFCEECGSEISVDEKFCTSCGTQKPESSSPPTVDVVEPTPEPETKQETESVEEQASGGFAFTADGDIGESSTRETAREGLTRKISELEARLEQTKATKSQQQELEEYEKKYLGKSKTKVSRKTYKVKATRKTVQIKLKSEPKKKSRQQELEEYEKKYLNESETNVSWKAYDVKAKRKVEIQNPKAVKMKNGKWAVKGTSPITGIKVFRIVGNEKPAVSAEKTADSPKAKEEQTTPAEKTKTNQKARKEVFSRYYRPPEAESPKVKKSKSKKPNLFCEECGSKIAAKDMFCTNCGAKR
uniref:Zinc-ribbon domain-containing protein n=1 Tax=uncultured marine thaumarchaeote KM3_44_G08 TaxID=1456152 RepID=A0A075H257_9ARCH|nr:hypothetical protein [uncultured marine thaumarchaeote KM3_44_G08]